MRLLSIVNADGSPAGVIEEVASSLGATFDTIVTCRGQESAMRLGDPVPASIAEYDGLVVLGGHMGVNDADTWPFLEDIKNLMREAHRSQVPVLGVCLGAQLLASAHGASVAPEAASEYGFTEISFLETARQDPLLAHAPEKLHLMQWHDDMFEVPTAGILVAGSETCAHQAFRIGDMSWGFQFHFEVTEDTVRHWARLYAHEMEEPEERHVEAIDAQLAEHYAEHRRFAENLTRAFIRVVTERAESRRNAMEAHSSL